MSATPLVSFVLPCYNYGRYLGDCLGSIFAQEGCQDFEIIAVNDASSDNTRELLEDCRDPRLRVFHHEKNQGHIITVNEGLAAARGRFMARIDPDDRYRPYFLSSVLEKFERYPEVAFVYGDASLMNDVGTVWVESTDKTHGGADFKGNEYLRLLEGNFVCAPTTIARREAWEKVLPIPKGLAFNDWYINLMLARRYEFYYIHRVLADYRVHGSNHHALICKDGSEEASILRLLDQVYGETEASPELEAAKRRARNQVYAAQYLVMGEKYFGEMQNEDARRCYWNAVKHRPSCLLQAGVLRRFGATLTNRHLYEFGKSILKGRSPQAG